MMLTTGIRRALPLVLSCTFATSTFAATTHPQSVAESGVDAGIRPGDDFFAYANGAWLQATQIPDAEQRWGARNEISDLTLRQLEKLIDDAAGAPVDSNARKVADFRAAYL